MSAAPSAHPTMTALHPVQPPPTARSIDKLPAEMLGEIFLRLHEDEIGVECDDDDDDYDDDDLAGLDDDSDAEVPHDPNPSEFAAAAAVAAVSRVCRAWRAAAVGHQVLWSHIEFDFFKIGWGLRYKQRFLDAWLRYLRIHLARAGAHPLSLYISSLRIEPSSWEGSYSQRAWRDLVDALPRCLVFRLYVNCFDLGAGDFYLPWQFQAATPLLEEFTLVCLSEDPFRRTLEYARDDAATFLPSAPRLRRLRIDCGIPRCATLSPFPVLDELEFETASSSPRPVDILQTLRLSRHISKLYIPRDYEYDKTVRAPLPPAQASPVLALPHLKVISSMAGIGVLEHVAPALVCPNLRTLEPGSYSGRDAEFRALCLLGGTITTLKFGHFGVYYAAGALPHVLRAVPLLEEISFQTITFHADDFRVLGVPDAETGRWIAPRLQRVTCERASMTGIVSDVQAGILRFVRSRTSRIPVGSSVRPLRIFTIGRDGSSRDITRLVPNIERLLRMAPELEDV